MLGLFKKKQDWNASIVPADQQVMVKAGDNLLKAALTAGLSWPHDCRVGSCGTCRCTLKQGKVKELSDFSYVLEQEQLQQGMILACQSELNSDVVVEVELREKNSGATVRSYEGVICSVRPLTHDIMELVIKADTDLPRVALAGQYAELSIDAISQPRSYSFARAPKRESASETTFYVRKVPGGEFTEWLFAEDRKGQTIVLSGPYGEFSLQEGDSPIVCIAGGSGLAPIKAILESAVDEKSERDLLFLFGARSQKDLYCLKAMAELEISWKGKFSFIPVLSAEDNDTDWTGARGMVTDYLQSACDEADINLRISQGYLCGPPAMVDAAVSVLRAGGMTKNNIYFDKFLDASSMPGGR